MWFVDCSCISYSHSHAWQTVERNKLWKVYHNTHYTTAVRYHCTEPIQISKNCRSGWGVALYLKMILHSATLSIEVGRYHLTLELKPFIEVKCRLPRQYAYTLRLLLSCISNFLWLQTFIFFGLDSRYRTITWLNHKASCSCHGSEKMLVNAVV